MYLAREHDTGEIYTCDSRVMRVNLTGVTYLSVFVFVLLIRTSDNGVYIEDQYESNGCGSVQYLEHVEVWLEFSATYRGSIQVGYKFYTRNTSVIFVQK